MGARTSLTSSTRRVVDRDEPPKKRETSIRTSVEGCWGDGFAREALLSPDGAWLRFKSACFPRVASIPSMRERQPPTLVTRPCALWRHLMRGLGGARVSWAFHVDDVRSRSGVGQEVGGGVEGGGRFTGAFIV